MTAQNLGFAASLTCSGIFFVFAAVLAVTRRSPLPRELPAMSDLGPQTPAVANLLANGGDVTPDAVPATLLDLAARRVVTIEESTPATYSCRLGAQPSASLTPYEAQVLALLRRRAVDGVVPAQALTAGPEDEARGWMKNFRSNVVGEAGRAGLCAARWPPRAVALMAGLVLIAVVLALNSSNDESTSFQEALAIGVSIFAAAVLTWVFRDDAQMLTASGVEAQARWLALRHFLRDDEVFAGLPPTAVAVRDRYMAYGAALGAASAAVRAIPMGAESDRWAWSRYGGSWAQVRVSYRNGWMPVWGISPRQAASRAAWVGGLGLFWLWVSSLLLPHVDFGPGTDQLTRDVSAGIVLVAALSVVAVATGLWLLLVAAAALLDTREVTGEAIRIRGSSADEGLYSYVAVYQGNIDHVHAWVAEKQTLAGIHEYDVITVRVSPLLGYIRSAHRLKTPLATPLPRASS